MQDLTLRRDPTMVALGAWSGGAMGCGSQPCHEHLAAVRLKSPATGPPPQRFRRRSEFGPSESEDEGDEWQPEGEAAEADDRADPGLHCKSVYAMWAEKGLVPPKNLRGYGTATPRPLRQVGRAETGRRARHPRPACACPMHRHAMPPLHPR